MEKIKFWRFIKEYVIVNSMLLGAYLAVTIIITMFFGNAMTEFVNAILTGEHQNPTLTVIYFLLRVAVFAGFFVLSFLRLSNNAEEKRAFLSSIGTERFDIAEFSEKNFAERGKQTVIYFATIVGVGTVSSVIGVPLVSLIVSPQVMMPTMLIGLCGITGVANVVISVIFTVILNTVAYFIYQRQFCPKIYQKWADERMRIL